MSERTTTIVIHWARVGNWIAAALGVFAFWAVGHVIYLVVPETFKFTVAALTGAVSLGAYISIRDLLK